MDTGNLTSAQKAELKAKIYDNARINKEEALQLFAWNLPELGRAADFRRSAAVPEAHVGFILDRIINFTNVCEAACHFCAYHAGAGQVPAYRLTTDEICRRAEALAAAGGTQVMLQGGLHPDFRLNDYIDMLKAVRERLPELYLHCFSPAEIVHAAKKSGQSLDEVIGPLQAAGLDSVPGASDLLVDRIRREVSPRKLSTGEWCEVMHSLHRHGLKSSATMTYGMGESLAERIEHLSVVRQAQDETGIVRAFIPWSFSPARTRMAHIPAASGIDYLKIVAVSRIYLDNVSHIQAGWLTEGLKPAQIALAMGADDMGGILMEEVVVKATGIERSTRMEQFVELIRNAGRVPVQRDSEYTILRRF